MAILQYKCPVCGREFEELVKKYDDEVLCPDCKVRAERSYSGAMFPSTGNARKKCSGHCSTCSGCK